MTAVAVRQYWIAVWLVFGRTGLARPRRRTLVIRESIRKRMESIASAKASMKVLPYNSGVANILVL